MRAVRCFAVLPAVLLFPLVAAATTINVPADYPTINAAIAAAANGDQILLAPGTYVENVVVNKSVGIGGSGQGSTIVMPATSNPNCGGMGGGSLCAGGSNVFLIQASNVGISSLTIDGDNPMLAGGIDINGANVDARNGIIEDFNAGVFNGTSIQSVLVRNIYLRGIYFSSGGSGFIANLNTVQNVAGGTSSIGIFNFGGSGQIFNNGVSQSADGIAANHSRGTQISGNVVTTSASGIHTDNAGDSAGSVPDTITFNGVLSGGAGSYGIFVFVPYIAPAVHDNAVSGSEVGMAIFGQGDPAIATTFDHNTIDGTSLPNSVCFFATTDQLGFGTADTHANAASNNLLRCSEGVHVDQPGNTITLRLAANRIVHNTLSLNNTSATLVDATDNWWGCNYGPGATGPNCTVTPGGVTGPATTTPWLVLGTSGPGTLANGATASYTASLQRNSNGIIPVLMTYIPNGTPVTFAGVLGTVAPPAATTASALASTNFTAGHTPGAGSVNSTVDDQTATAPVTITDAALTATPASISGTEGSSLTAIVATFTDADPSPVLSDFTATIAWGDGNTTAGTITSNGAGFNVTGTHTYATSGSFPVTVTINDAGGASAVANSSATIADAALTASGVPVSFTPSTPFTGIVATFTDANPLATAGMFTATINWGDGNTTAGTVSASGGGFNVTGTHTYTGAGPFTITTTINDVGGASATASSQAANSVAIPLAGGLGLALMLAALALAGWLATRR
jgi:hypothetical protein